MPLRKHPGILCPGVRSTSTKPSTLPNCVLKSSTHYGYCRLLRPVDQFPPSLYITLRRSKQPTTGATVAAYNWDNESHRSVSLLEIVSRRPPPPVNSLLGAYCTYTKHPRPPSPSHPLFARTNCANFRVSLEVVDIGVDTISLDCKHSHGLWRFRGQR